MTYDPQAESRSLMHKQKVLCNGMATGHPCIYYWCMIRIASSHNPDFLKQGEKRRFCRAWGAEPLEMDEGISEMAVQCSMYVPDTKRVYDPSFEEYSPIGEDELVQIGTVNASPNLPVPNAPFRVSTSTEPAFTAADAVDEANRND
jgi:hypothetical protein